MLLAVCILKRLMIAVCRLLLTFKDDWNVWCPYDVLGLYSLVLESLALALSIPLYLMPMHNAIDVACQLCSCSGKEFFLFFSANINRAKKVYSQ